MRKFKRRSFGSGSRLEQSEEAPALDLSRDYGQLMKELLQEITRKEQMPTSKRMGYLNNFTQLLRCVPPDTNFGVTSQEIITCLKVSLVSPSKEIRAATLRALRHFLQTEDHMTALLNERVDIFIARSLDLVAAFEVERVQALRLVRKMVFLCPTLFPVSLGMALASVSSDSSQDKDRMATASLATLCELAIKNVAVATYCGAVNAIIMNILDCSIQRMNESLIVTLLYLFNHPQFRVYLRPNAGIEGVLAPFTDLYYRHSIDIPDSTIKEDQENRIEAARMALVTIFRSWPGIFNMCNPDGTAIDSFLGVFRLPNETVRAGILETLYDILCLRLPVWTDDFAEALDSVDPSTMQETWRLTEGFVVDEAQQLLPHRAGRTRTNLVESYRALVLDAFIDAGLLESLVEVITTSDDHLSIRCTILLGELLHMANTLLPPSCSGHTHCLPTLMSIAANLEVSSSERGKASAAIGYLDQLHQLKKRGTVPCSLFLEQIVHQASIHLGKQTRAAKEKADMSAWKIRAKVGKPQHLMLMQSRAVINQEAEDILSAIRDTQVLSATDYLLNWDWDLIATVLDSPKLSVKKQEDPTYLKFVRRLLQFYKSSSKQFCLIETKHELARKYSEVGLLLIDFLLRKEEQPDGERLLQELVTDTRDSLTEAVAVGTPTGVFSLSSIVDTLSQMYFLYIGKLSSSTLGTKVLERTSGIFQYLLDTCGMSGRESMLKLMISSFDYGRDGIARVLLAKALTSASPPSKLYATKFLRVLLRAKTPYFSNWGMELLANQLYDQENEVVAEAISVLQEACEDEANLQRLIEIRPALLHLAEKGILLLIRYLSINRGFSYLSEVDYVEPLVESWRVMYNFEYVRWMEAEITEALSSYEKNADEGTYIRRSNRRDPLKDVYVLPHLYGELAQHRAGIQLIQDKGLLRDSVEHVMNKEQAENAEGILHLKAALWALGHIGSTAWGIPLLLPASKVSQSVDRSLSEEATEFEGDDDDWVDIIEMVVWLAQNSEILTIRGTCFYVLGLLSKTTQGADKLEDLGWECVRHKGAEQWPVVEQELAFISFEDESDEDEDTERDDADDDTSNVTTTATPADRFGGVYLGEDLGDYETDIYHHEAFEYTRITLGEEKRGKRPRRTQSEDLLDAKVESNFKTTEYNVDKDGRLYERESISLVCGLERVVNSLEFGSMYMEEKDPLNTSGIGSQTRTSSDEFDLQSTLKNLQEQTIKHSTTEPNLSSMEIRGQSRVPSFSAYSSSSVNGDVSWKKAKPTRSVFHSSGIYMGEEDISDNERDESLDKISIDDISERTVTGSFSSLRDSKALQEERPRRKSSMEPESLVPIQEATGVVDFTAPAPMREISIDVPSLSPGRDRFESNSSERDYDDSSLHPDSFSEISSLRTTPTEGPTPELHEDDELSRVRSVSLTERGPDTTKPYEAEGRSASFSGSTMHSHNMRARNARAGSDPCLSPEARTSSFSSQDSDVVSNELKVLGRKVEREGRVSTQSSSQHRRRRRENSNRTESTGSRDRSDSEERYRSVSFASEGGNSSPLRMRRLKMPRGSTLSLSVSPRSFRNGSVSSVPESPMFTSSRDARGYAAWNTLRKQRNFRRELEVRLKRSSSSSPQEALWESRQRFRRVTYVSTKIPHEAHVHDRRTSSPAVISGVSRTSRQFSVGTSISSTGSAMEPFGASGGELGSNAEDYVGRCLPCNLADMFRISRYKYSGLPSATNIIVSFDPNTSEYTHTKDKCLACMNSTSDEFNKENKAPDIDEVTHLRDEDSPSPDELKEAGKEVIRLVINLSSAVASKASQQGLLALRERYPALFQDLCLFCQAMDQLGIYQFRLGIRRFIEALFDSVNYSKMFQRADYILRNGSIENS